MVLYYGKKNVFLQFFFSNLSLQKEMCLLVN